MDKTQNVSWRVKWFDRGGDRFEGHCVAIFPIAITAHLLANATILEMAGVHYIPSVLALFYLLQYVTNGRKRVKCDAFNATPVAVAVIVVGRLLGFAVYSRTLVERRIVAVQYIGVKVVPYRPIYVTAGLLCGIRIVRRTRIVITDKSHRAVATLVVPPLVFKLAPRWPFHNL